MKAIVYRDYGSPDVLSCEEVPRPVPADNQVLIKVRAASVNPLDWKLMKGGPWIVRALLGAGKSKIKRPGVDVSGLVEALGGKVDGFKPGDAVFGTCAGSFADYAVSESVFGLKSQLVLKPENVSFEQAASSPVAALTALQGLRDKGRLKPGQSVLVNGAAGGVGTFAVQMAKVFGAKVTGVCSTRNVELVRTLGADKVVDYTQEDFAESGQRYDLALDCVGNRTFAAYKRVLDPGGTLVMIGAPPDAALPALMLRLIGDILRSKFAGPRMVFFIAKINKEDLTAVGEMMAGAKLTPVIDRLCPLSEVPEAIRYLEEGHARGKVVVTL